MSVSILIRTVAVSNSTAGEFKFEIYRDEENYFFYADISKKKSDGIWELFRDSYRLSRALDIDNAVNSCIKFVNNLEIDLKIGKIF